MTNRSPENSAKAGYDNWLAIPKDSWNMSNYTNSDHSDGKVSLKNEAKCDDTPYLYEKRMPPASLLKDPGDAVNQNRGKRFSSFRTWFRRELNSPAPLRRDAITPEVDWKYVTVSRPSPPKYRSRPPVDPTNQS